MQRDDDGSEFEDPALRSAIRRVWSDQTAPAELRRRLAEIAAAESSPSPRIPPAGPVPLAPIAFAPSARAPARWYRRPIFGLAAAAIVLIAVGIFSFKFALHPGAIPVAALSLPENLADNLVIRHDACCRLPDHHGPDLPRNDLKAIAVVLRTRLGFPVMSGEPSAAGWQFDGASICEVGNCPGAHLIFKRPDQDISVFSLPISFDPQAAGKGEFALMDADHPIAGFATATAFYAVVGSSTDNSLSLASVTAMCNRLKPMVMSAPRGQAGVALFDSAFSRRALPAVFSFAATAEKTRRAGPAG